MLLRCMGLLLLCASHNLYAGAIASAHPVATQAGVHSLEAGGNAFDAAVAVTAALAVVEPYSSGLGGGGFYLLYIASETRYVFLDARETAPLKAHSDMYLDAAGDVVPQASINGPLAAGIPGIPAALQHLSDNYGVLPLEIGLKDAIKAAEQGFVVDSIYQRLANWRKPVLKRFAPIFLHNGEVPEIGSLVRQPDLAKTLRMFSKDGAKVFYNGVFATNMIDAVRSAGGIWSKKDFSSYRVKEREPIAFSWQGNILYSAPPPSSGGVALAQILQQLSTLPKTDKAVKQYHYLIESMRRAYRDRALYMGDSDFVDIPLRLLLSKDYAAGLAAGIHPEQASKSSAFSVKDNGTAGNHTTHFSIVDKYGNKVAATLSINYPFGSGFIAGDTGILLNDEMDDFVAKPGTPNAYGLVGGSANAIQPGKRMLSSMSPTIVEMAERTVVLGTPGGSRIITMVLQGILEAQEGGSALDMVSRRRIHHQFLPDVVQAEKGALTAKDKQNLEELGHKIEERDTWGNLQVVIEHKSGKLDAASDARGVGQSWVADKHQ